MKFSEDLKVRDWLYKKCEFFKDEIQYLGCTINKHGLKKSDDKIKAITDAPVL